LGRISNISLSHTSKCRLLPESGRSLIVNNERSKINYSILYALHQRLFCSESAENIKEDEAI